MSDLKPCPLCGDDKPFIERMETNVFAVRCNECLCTGPSGEDMDHDQAELDAINSWNNRPYEEKLAIEQRISELNLFKSDAESNIPNGEMVSKFEVIDAIEHSISKLRQRANGGE